MHDQVVNEDDDDCGIECDCGPRAPHPKPVTPKTRGWKREKEVPIDGTNWPLGFAADQLDLSERDLRDLIRIIGLKPTGTMKMTTYSRSGRNPRVYNAGALIKINETVKSLARMLGTLDRD
jgi:hypothetical protein